MKDSENIEIVKVIFYPMIGLMFLSLFFRYVLGISFIDECDIQQEKEHQAIIEQLSGLQIEIGDAMMMIDALDNKQL